MLCATSWRRLPSGGALLRSMAPAFAAGPDSPAARRSPHQRGFALLIVLWTLGLLSLLIVGLATRARSATSVAGNVRGRAIVEAAADGAVQQAIFQLRGGGWPLGGPSHRIVIGRATVDVAVVPQRDRVNPNLSPPLLLTGLLDRVGVDPTHALVLARALIDWRTITPVSLGGGLKLEHYQRAQLPYGPPGRPFTSVSEIGLVPGMSADLLARLEPYVSVYQRGDENEMANNPVGSDTPTGDAVTTRSASLIALTSQEAIVRIRATAVLADGTQFMRDTIVRLVAQAKPGERSWQVLTWD
jgi:general secretion pathway protein K